LLTWKALIKTVCVQKKERHTVFYFFVGFLPMSCNWFLNLFFSFVEFAAFVLPCLPDSLWIRLIILGSYYILHIARVQYEYVKFKKWMLSNKNEMDECHGDTAEVVDEENGMKKVI